MVRTLLILTVLAILPHSSANAEFAIDAFVDGASFFGSPSTAPIVDDFGNTYDVTRTFSTTGTINTLNGTAVDLLNGQTARIDYDFTPTSVQSPSNTFALGFYANDFQIRELNTTPNDSIDISVIAERQNGNLGQFTVEDVTNGDATVFFDLTNLGDVGVLNDLATLSFVFEADNTTGGAGASIDFQNFALVATPEPTSAASFGLLGLIGLISSTRRRKK